MATTDHQLRMMEKLQSTSTKGTDCNLEEDNCFCTINLGSSIYRVILYFSEGNPLGPLLQKRVRDIDYTVSLFHSQERVVEECLLSRHPALIVMDTEHKPIGGLGSVEQLSRTIHSNKLHHTVKLLPVVKSYSAILSTGIPSGVSRVLSEEDCRGDQFLLALKLWEKNEALQQKKLLLGNVLFEAVEQSSDAIQITGPDSCIMFVNRAFADISGYSREEVVGKPAMDILRTIDSKSDNGPKLAVSQNQSWDGVCLGRRKSGSILRQHIKLIPVKTNEGRASFHITIQRLLSYHDSDHSRITSPRTMHGDRLHAFSTRQASLGSIPNLGSRLEIPITKAVQVLSIARDNTSTPVYVKEALEQAMEILCSAELFSPVSGGRGNSQKDIVAGLLSGGRFPGTGNDITRVAHPHSHLARNPPITPPPPEVEDAIQNLDRWEFDIINLEKLSSNEPLYYVGIRVFKNFNVCEILEVEESVMASWLKLMESHYHRQNAYHNSTHAADVLQATAYFIKILQDYLVSQGDMLERLEIAALLITAVIHDLDHPGRTNPHLCNTKHHLATLYNDSAVLENHHIALSFKITEQSKGLNIYQNLDSVTYRNLRSSIIDLVLATDMAKHFEHLAKFNMYSVDGETGSSTSLTSKDNSRENRMAMKRVLVKCADISNPCRPTELCQEWATRISEEYFNQTDEERRRNLPVVFPDFDRKTCILPVTQVKFIDFFISGLFDAWHNFCPIPLVMDYLKANYEFWNNKSPSNETAD
ncbi:high affinity cAMP-specific and IBMX-insensitive 3',5'-cyclic phosphodiesterase 8B-like [Halichondria panicea]|uniref:high affinity cAMP-specific and IBMX-insensitive 3',5'-cyclic phosphodiesterase 8B-like n=1 Tax=Halichondria panicea TaxID=6063 RepID=UPI00312BB412